MWRRRILVAFLLYSTVVRLEGDESRASQETTPRRERSHPNPQLINSRPPPPDQPINPVIRVGTQLVRPPLGFHVHDHRSRPNLAPAAERPPNSPNAYSTLDSTSAAPHAHTPAAAPRGAPHCAASRKPCITGPHWLAACPHADPLVLHVRLALRSGVSVPAYRKLLAHRARSEEWFHSRCTHHQPMAIQTLKVGREFSARQKRL